MNIIKFETGSELDKSLAIVLDCALKAQGTSVLQFVNLIKDSIQSIPDEQIPAVFETVEVVKKEKTLD